MTARAENEGPAPDDITVVVGRIGRAHGLAGELSVELRTDDPELRFVDGALLHTSPTERGPLLVERTRWANGRLFVRFAGVGDRTAAEALRNTLLEARVAADERPRDPEEYFDRQLVGCAVVTTTGVEVGDVAEVLHLPGQDLLAVRSGDGEVLVPFVAPIVPEVDLDARRLTIDPPPGLLGDEPE